MVQVDWESSGCRYNQRSARPLASWFDVAQAMDGRVEEDALQRDTLQGSSFSQGPVACRGYIYAMTKTNLKKGRTESALSVNIRDSQMVQSNGTVIAS